MYLNYGKAKNTISRIQKNGSSFNFSEFTGICKHLRKMILNKKARKNAGNLEEKIACESQHKINLIELKNLLDKNFEDYTATFLILDLRNALTIK